MPPTSTQNDRREPDQNEQEKTTHSPKKFEFDAYKDHTFVAKVGKTIFVAIRPPWLAALMSVLIIAAVIAAWTGVFTQPKEP